ncbi:hypothetical protein KBB76_01095 [Candidatus Saccharibacteria bacterium]|nr:hypothetical protein [Candidatus Saccharibacteria bacterium]HPW48190.1 hypothetical protein [Candidatus Saccharibacteria bacterium]
MKLPSRIIKIFVLVALVAAISWGINSSTTAQQAARARFSIEPHSGSFVVGNTINLSIYEECSQSGVNTLQANVIYDTSRLQFISASSPLALVPPENTAGRVPLAVYQIGGLSAGKHHVATVAFRAVAAGTTTISFGSDSAIIMPVGENLILTQVWDGNTTGATFTLTSPTSSSPPPTSSTPVTGSTPAKPTAPSSVPSPSKPAGGSPSTGGNAGRSAPQPSQQPTASPSSTTSPAVAGLAENVSLVAVKIFGEGGKLLPGIKVTINNQTVLTDASGIASFVGLKPGTYKVKAIINGKEIEKFINVKGVSTVSGVQEFSIGQKTPTPYTKIVVLSVALVAMFIIVIFIIRKVLSKNNDYTGGITSGIITSSSSGQAVTTGESETTLNQQPTPPDSGDTVGKIIGPTQVPEKGNTQQGDSL